MAAFRAPRLTASDLIQRHCRGPTANVPASGSQVFHDAGAQQAPQDSRKAFDSDRLHHTTMGSFRRFINASFWSLNCGEMMNSVPSVAAGSSTVKPTGKAASNSAPAGVRM